MIVLEFRYPENFLAACRLLESRALAFECEPMQGAPAAGRLLIQPDPARPEPLRRLLALAQGFARKDRVQRSQQSRY